MRSLSLSALTLSSSLLMMLLLLSSKRCGASISLPEMDGDLPLYSIAGSNLDLEFMMDSEINRMLASRGQDVYGTLDKNKPLINCGQGVPYAACLAGGNKRTCAKLYRGPCK
ncbi:hypothetical protein OIU76_028159 [Salix suchowensis]|nr:hypothetical protein OIU76_028159 [Salix suchowensis]